MSDEDERVTETHDIDWPALWREFGFHTPDSVGARYASRTQLRGAIEGSDQQIEGEPQAHIEQAVSAGALQPVRRTDECGGTHVAGWICVEVHGDE